MGQWRTSAHFRQSQGGDSPVRRAAIDQQILATLMGKNVQFIRSSIGTLESSDLQRGFKHGFKYKFSRRGPLKADLSFHISHSFYFKTTPPLTHTLPLSLSLFHYIVVQYQPPMLDWKTENGSVEKIDLIAAGISGL